MKNINLPAYKPAHTPTYCNLSLPVLRKGDIGVVVRTAQELLFWSGYDVGVEYELGKFGNRTEQGFKQFQQQHYLPITGVVDAATWQKLIIG